MRLDVLEGIADPDFGRTACGSAVLALAVIAGGMTLCHTFLGPCGTGVSGGRAKLVWMFRGLPPGFFTDPAYDLYQAAYPPLQALIVLGGDLAAGGCGEWLLQLMVVGFSCTLFLLVARTTRPHAAALALLFAFFLPHPVLVSTTTFCSEPLMALLVLAGWFRIRDGKDDGWIILGCAGLVKNEGILYLPAIWLALRLLSGRAAARPAFLALGLLPAAAWHVGCRALGTSLHDFAPVWSPDPIRAGIACLRVLRECFLTPWHYAFAFPLAVALAISGARHPSARFGRLVVPLAAVFLLLAFVFVYSLSRAPDFEWHLDSLPRLLWPVALLLLSESLVAFDCSAVARSDDS